jgi:hypothetical protein
MTLKYSGLRQKIALLCHVSQSRAGQAEGSTHSLSGTRYFPMRLGGGVRSHLSSMWILFEQMMWKFTFYWLEMGSSATKVIDGGCCFLWRPHAKSKCCHGAAGVAHWKIVCLACAKIQILSPAPKNSKLNKPNSPITVDQRRADLRAC